MKIKIVSKTAKKSSINDFTEQDKVLYPLLSPEKKYPEHLAVLQNAFWLLQHEKPPKDDMLKLLMFFSPKVRLSNNLPTEQTVYSIKQSEQQITRAEQRIDEKVKVKQAENSIQKKGLSR